VASRILSLADFESASTQVWHHTMTAITDIAILLTQTCDKACSFCCVDARPHTKNHLPYSLIVKLRGDLLAHGIRPDRIGLTGGEAFLYASEGRTIVDVFDLLHDIPADHISVQTSGISELIPTFQSDLMTLANRSYSGRVRISSSFNLYQRPGIVPRMTETIDLVTRLFRFIHLQNAFDAGNAQATVDAFCEMMNVLGFEGPSLAILDAVLRHRQWVHRTGQRCVVTHFYPAYRAGRGLKTLKNVYVKGHQTCTAVSGDRHWLTVDWDGNAKLCNSIAAWVCNPRLGTIDGDFGQLLCKYANELEFVQTYVANQSWERLKAGGFESFCQFCAKLRAIRARRGPINNTSLDPTPASIQ